MQLQALAERHAQAAALENSDFSMPQTRSNSTLESIVSDQERVIQDQAKELERQVNRCCFIMSLWS